MKSWAWIPLAAAAAASLAAAACSAGEELETQDEPIPPSERIELRKDVDPGPGAWDQPEGHLAGTVDWYDVSTKDAETFMGGALVVDKVRRQQADGVLGVDIRLHNRTGVPVEGTYTVEFRSATHDVILGHKREAVSFLVDPYGYAVVGDSAVTAGAIGFRLFIQSKGASNPGYSDPKESNP